VALPEYPYQPRTCRIGALSLRYLDEGSGDPVLMLHGNPSWSYYYRKLVAGLQDTHRCIVPDHIGMGGSDKPGDADYAYRLERRVADLDALVAHLTDTQGLPRTGLTLVLHDWGGMIGMAWAVRNPGRVARIVVLNTAAFPNPKGMRIPLSLRLGRDSRLGAWLILQHNAFARGAARWGVVRPLAPAIRDAYVSPYDSPAHRLATLRFVQDIPLTPADPGYDLVQATGQGLAQFADRPMLVCWGLKDFVFDARFLAEWRARFPGAEVHAWEDAGHYVLEDAHERIVPLVRDFLARHPLAR